MIQAVLFDLDGTLVEQEQAAARAVVEWAAEHGDIGADVAVRWARISGRHYGRYQRRELTFAEQRRVRVREFLRVPEATDAEADALFEGYVWRYEAGWSMYDDAVPALRRVRAAGLRAIVFTNGNTAHQTYKLGRFGLLDELDEFISAEDFPAGKPDPRAFELALAQAGLRADEALMVGDSLENDVQGAQAVGMPAVLLDRLDHHPQLPRITSLAALAW
ncbi:HAD family hydrolase [Kribbella sandramycini]|uniref:HAD family hydrolase n=1 Tax=Kribbella sandramycini TaxID=60450 RepID=A0A7Y4KY79_9ACTN|nr:putative hydrolase of the HAD superfamily [Kribbella sandramycini]NOL40859.1 HAD family hydrolase [Kribbella sandramycini]